MRRVLLALGGIFLLAAGTFAQKATLFGTKPDLVVAAPTSSAPLVDGWALAQMFVALGVVLALIKFGLPWVVKYFRAPAAVEATGDIKLKSSVACGTSNLQVVEVRGKEILVAVHTSGVTYITDLPAVASESQPAFFEMLESRVATTEAVENRPDLKSIKNPKVAALQTGPEPAKKRARISDKAPTEPVAEAAPADPDFEDSLRILREARLKMESRQATTRLSR